MATSTIRPGLLVALKTSVTGGVKYERRDIEQDSHRTRWETVREVTDPDEHERAAKLRTQISGSIRSTCITTSFGLLCPTSREEELDIAIESAQRLAAAFNADAKFTQIKVYVLKGRVSESDSEAARAITQEVGELIDSMNDALDKADPKAIRDAANRARLMSSMLSETAQEQAKQAIKAARDAATMLVRRVEKAGEDAGAVLAEVDRSAINQARIAFLDLDDGETVSPLPAIERQRFADLVDDESLPMVRGAGRRIDFTENEEA